MIGAMFSIGGMTAVTILVMQDIIYIFGNIHDWPFYGGEGKDGIARGLLFFLKSLICNIKLYACVCVWKKKTNPKN